MIAPFTSGIVDVRAESSAGLDVAALRVESGVAWYGARGWLPATRAEASLERTVLSVNDRPVAIVASARYDSALAEASAAVGLRLAVVQHRTTRGCARSRRPSCVRPPSRIGSRGARLYGCALASSR